MSSKIQPAIETPTPHQRELAGGSFHWWPPTGDHKILFAANPLRCDFFERYLPQWSGLHVLDVGCGGGYTCEHLARRNAVMSGVDILPAAIHQALAHARQENLQIDYRVCKANTFPFEDNQMDVVTCFDMLEHVVDKQSILAEIHRVLKPNGWLFFDTLSKTLTARLLTIWIGEVGLRLIARGTHDWHLFIRPHDLKKLIASTGFDRIELAGLIPAWSFGAGKLPVKISPRGSQTVIYFGAARKGGDKE